VDARDQMRRFGARTGDTRAARPPAGELPEHRFSETHCVGAPGNSELIDTYQHAQGAEVRDLAWFEALVRYKQIAVTALLIRNARRRNQYDGGFPETTARLGTPSARGWLCGAPREKS
jgi:aminoglycoside phosphotransferase (APT) family kinase protein